MTFIADPTSRLDYAVDWSSWLAEGDVITTSTWTVPDGITESTPAPSHTDTTATIWLTGGTVGTAYRVTNHVTTAAGRKHEQSFSIVVRDL